MPCLYDGELQNVIQCCGSLYIWSVPNKPRFWVRSRKGAYPKIHNFKDLEQQVKAVTNSVMVDIHLNYI